MGVAERHLIVNGGINNLQDEQRVNLQWTTQLGRAPEQVVGAKVLFIENQSKTYVLHSSNPGTYTINITEFKPVMGSSYSIEVHTVDGLEFKSAPEVMLPVIAIDSLQWDIRPRTVVSIDGLANNYKALNVYTTTSLPSTDLGVYLKWDVQSAYQFSTLPECNPFKTIYTCYFGYGTNEGDLMLFSNSNNAVRHLSRFPVGYEFLSQDYKFVETHYYSVYQHRISQPAYEYFNKLKTISTLNGSIFDPIPSSVAGNVSNIKDPKNKVLGYFLVSSADIKRIKLESADFAGIYPLLDKANNYCSWLFGSSTSYFQPCCDCSFLPDPLIQKPSWW